MSFFSINIHFCSQCGAETESVIPEGDSLVRDVCTQCHKIHYQNPKVIAGCLPIFENKVLLCQRAIEPRKGFWTLPAGFLEIGETIEEGALRETREESGAIVIKPKLYTIFNAAHVGQITMLFLATMPTPSYSAGIESLHVQLFDEQSIPWKNLAFQTISRTLIYFFSDRKAQNFPIRMKQIPPSKEYLQKHQLN